VPDDTVTQLSLEPVRIGQSLVSISGKAGREKRDENGREKK